jgi:hypothetical protein
MIPLGKSNSGWEDNIKMYNSEIGWKVMDFNHLVQDREGWGGTSEHENKTLVSIKGGELGEYLNVLPASQALCSVRPISHYTAQTPKHSHLTLSVTASDS